jgi:UDP-glucose:(heptosyl)LPS alpha-1,3-glucosyltransferase
VDVYWPHGGLHRATLAAGERSRGPISGGVSRALHKVSVKHRTFLRLEDKLLTGGGARRVWCVSSLVRDEIAAAHTAAGPRLEVHPNGVDLATFHPGLRAERRAEFLRRHRIDAASAVLVFPGGNWTLKGWDVLWTALAEVGGRWLLVAAGDDADLIATPRGLCERAVLLPRQDARDLWGAADLVVQPTWRDPCSLATLEALASGVPVATTDANGASDAVRTSGVGGVVAAGDVAGWAALLSRCVERLGDPAAAAADRTRAREAASGRPEDAWLRGLAASLRGARTN